MHYYNEAFHKVLEAIPGVEVQILSNYNENRKKAFFLNQYRGNLINKVSSLVVNLLRLKKQISKNPESLYIYLSYGNRIDVLFMNVVSRAKHHLIDIHEAIAQHVDKKQFLITKISNLYKSKINAVISHSSRTDDFLKEFGYIKKIFTVPHFKYVYPKEYEIKNVPDGVLKAVLKNKINILFFGNLTESKGVDILMDAINRLDNKIASKANFIIAGKDFDGAIDRIPIASDRNLTVIRRHINDDELRFLYSNADYISLPYRKTSQSGILETAFYFKKPIIASSVEYFKRVLSQFPSFGVLAGNEKNSYVNILTTVINKHPSKDYFSESDYAKYENRKEINNFIIEFADWLKNNVG